MSTLYFKKGRLAFFHTRPVLFFGFRTRARQVDYQWGPWRNFSYTYGPDEHRRDCLDLGRFGIVRWGRMGARRGTRMTDGG